MDAATALDTTAPDQSTTPNAFGALNSEAFVKIMFTELSNQDPLKPNDSAALLQQMSSLRSIQSDIDLSKKLESLVQQNQLASAGGMIGNLVSGLSQDNIRVFGTVVSVSRTADGPVLNLDNGFRVPFNTVDEMAGPGVVQQPGPAPAPPTPPPTT
jgi:flagellar basal-body rod modification protein FlgD